MLISLKLLVVLSLFLKCLDCVLTYTNQSITDDEIIVEHGDHYHFLVQGGYRPRIHTLAKHLVSIRSGKPTKFFGDNHICGGSIIGDNIVLTAAHCIVNFNYEISLKNLTVVAGTPFRYQSSPYMKIYHVIEKIPNPIFSYMPLRADFAILKTDRNFEEDGKTIQRIPLVDSKPSAGTECVTIGWGKIFWLGPMPDEVLYLNLVVQKRLQCQKQFYMNPSIICANDKNDVDNAAGKGDSGGPFICNGKLAGVVSFGFKTGGSSFFSNVEDQLKWIMRGSANKIGLQLLIFNSNFFSLIVIVLILCNL